MVGVGVCRALTFVQQLLLAVGRNPTSMFNGVPVEGYPWVRALLEAPERASIVIGPALRRGCASNRTLSPGMTYAQFLNGSRNYVKFQRIIGKSGLVDDLVGRRAYFNLHLLVCPPAFLIALQVWKVYLFDQVLQFGATDVDFWNRGSREVQQVDAVLHLLRCHNCSQFDRDQFDKLWSKQESEYELADSFLWLRELLDTMTRELNQMSEDQPRLARVIATRSKDRSTHFRVLQLAAEFMHGLRDDGFLLSWVVASGTMIYALRYGNTGQLLPSGILDGARDLDMDVYVLVEDWTTFSSMVRTRGKQFGFDFCGWLPGWHKHSVFCLSSGIEIDIVRMDWGYARFIMPSNRCIIRRGQVANEIASSGDDDVAAAEASPTRSQLADRLELPCPNDPLAFMMRKWPISAHYLVNCLALPIGFKGELPNITDEDVRFIWQKSKELHMAGYASMAPLFSACKNHTKAELANKLGKDPWTEEF